MTLAIRIPQANPNDSDALLVKWHLGSGEAVQKHQLLCTIETSKAAVEVEAEADGFVQYWGKPGKRYAIGAAVGAITNEAKADLAALEQSLQAEAPEQAARPWTKKAALVAKRLGVDIELLAKRNPGKTLQEADVTEAAGAAQIGEIPATSQPAIAYTVSSPERIILLGGAAGAGSIACDIARRAGDQKIVGILDGNPETHGKEVHGGIPVLGPLSDARKCWEAGQCDAMLIVFTGDLVARKVLFDELRALGVRFTNLIDPSVIRRPTQRIGVGNLILGHSYLAVNARIGNNNFLASHTCIEHHSSVGDHCSFGPRSTVSGAVTIGDEVKFGMHVAVEPYLRIGSHSIIASGCIITTDIPAGAKVLAQQNYKIREES